MTNNNNNKQMKNKMKLPRGMTSIVDDLDRYSDTFMTGFWPNSTDVPVIRSWLQDNLDYQLIDKIGHRFPSNPLNVMGVGTGNGSMDSIIIDKFRKRFGNLRYTAIEPGCVIEEFKEEVESNDGLKDVVFDWKNTTISEVCRDASSYKNRFNFISAIHSAYYFDDVADTLSHLLDFLVDGGALMIIVNTDDNSLVKFLNNLSWQGGNTQSRLLEKIHQFAQVSAQHHEIFDLPAQIEVTSCFDETSEEGGKLLDFLSETAYFRETASKEIKEETMTVMRSLANEGKDGKLHFATNCRAIIMMKGHSVEKNEKQNQQTKEKN